MSVENISERNEEKEVAKLPFYQKVNGLTFCGMFIEQNIKEAMEYVPRDDDLFIVTYPKCGTTWVQHIVYLILTSGEPAANYVDFASRNPFLEMFGPSSVENMPRPGAIKTHLPPNYAPFSTKAKYIYIARNVKDACVSFFHHSTGYTAYKYEDGKFDDYFELYIDGKVDYGDYFDHLIGWWNRRNEPNVKFLTYEDLKADTAGCIRAIAEFIDPKYSEQLEAEPEVMENILKYSSFEYLKQAERSMTTTLSNTAKELIEQSAISKSPSTVKAIETFMTAGKARQGHSHFRKGVVNDWKSVMTNEQSQRLNDKFFQKCQATGLQHLWNLEQWM
ncbi:Sulfotransferase 1C2A [Halotydeus destructor]|nr:Sulfotransferase 1C2A [Halotydeus destructor]